jgi:chorismate dehydratase
MLPELAIASKRQVRSLLLVAKKPVGQVGSIALDTSSRSTQALTRILCADVWRIVPEFFEASPDLKAMLSGADAALLIGDPALRLAIQIEPRARRDGRGVLTCPAEAAGLNEKGTTPREVLYVYDIVEEWQRSTGLPAVLAIWAAREGVVTDEVLEDFSASRDFGMSHIPEISEIAARELELPASSLAPYLRRNIDYSLDADNRRGLEHFFARAAALGLIHENRAISWAGLSAAIRQTVGNRT